MRYVDRNRHRLFEQYVRKDDGSLWVADEIESGAEKKRREDSLRWLDNRDEDILYHSFFAEAGIPNTFEPGTARILSDFDFGSSMKHMPEIMKLRKIIFLINDIRSESEKYDENLNNLTYEDLYKKYETALMLTDMRMARRICTRQYEKNPFYVRIEIDSYIQAQTFIRYFEKPWELLLSEEWFDDYSQNGKNCIFFVLDTDYKEITYPEFNTKPLWSPHVDYSFLEMDDEDVRPRNYDYYGLSMMLVVTDAEGNLVRCTGRYDSAFDYENYLMYLDEEELSLILGVNFYEYFV